MGWVISYLIVMAIVAFISGVGYDEYRKGGTVDKQWGRFVAMAFVTSPVWPLFLLYLCWLLTLAIYRLARDATGDIMTKEGR